MLLILEDCVDIVEEFDYLFVFTDVSLGFVV